MTPVPGPVLEAMRDWIAGRDALVRNQWSIASSGEVLRAIDGAYPGRIAGFLRDHGNEGGDGA
jgi:hypothetical protein